MTAKFKLGSRSKCFSLIISLCFLVLSVIMLTKMNIIASKLPGKAITNVTSYSYGSMDLPTLIDTSDIIIRGVVTESLPSYQGKVKVIADNEMVKGNAEKAYEEGYDLVVISKEDAINKAISEFKKGKHQGGDAPIYTEKVVQVTKFYKNNKGASNKIVVRDKGGEIDGVVVRAKDGTFLAVGQEVILFLGKRANRYFPIMGEVGKYFIQGNNAIARDEIIDLDKLESEILS